MSEEDIDFLMSIQGLEQPEFDNAYLERENKKLEKEIERLNNIIKEVREYMNKHEIEEVYLDCKLYETQVYKDILGILDKGE